MQTLLRLFLPHKPLWSWTSPPSGDNYSSPLRSPPVRAQPAEHAPTPRAPFLPGSPFPAEHPAFLAQARLATFLPVWRSPRLAGPQETLLSRSAPARELPAEGPGALTPCPGPGGRRVERTRAPRPSPQAARLPLQRLPRGEGAGGGSGRCAADLLRLRAARLCSEGGRSSCGCRSSSGLSRRRARLSSAPSTPAGSPRAAAQPPGPRLPTWISSWRWCSGPRSTCRRPPSSTGGEWAPGRPLRLLSHAHLPRSSGPLSWRDGAVAGASLRAEAGPPRRLGGSRAVEPLPPATPRPSRSSGTQLPAGDRSLGRREARARRLGSEGPGQPQRGGDARGIPWRGTCVSWFRRHFSGETFLWRWPNLGSELSGSLTPRVALGFHGAPVCLRT